MINKETILNTLLLHKPDFAKLGVQHVGLFGSYASGEATEKSDIDILIDFEPEKESFDNFMAVYDLFESLFRSKHVEVVTRNGLSKHIGPKILSEVLYV